MHPILFSIGSFKVHSYGVMMVVAFFLALALARKRAPKYGISPDQITDAAFYGLLVGILGARIVFILQDLPHYLQHKDELFSLQFQGLTSFGGMLFGTIYLVLWAIRRKIPLLNVLDTMMAPMLLGQAIGRVGCLLNGCCYGGPTTLPWGIHVEGLADLHHPAQIYESIMDLAGLALLLWLDRRGLNRGQSLAVGSVLYGSARFIYEFWRAGSSSSLVPGLPITDAQVAAGLMILVGATLFIVFRNRGRVQQEQPA